MTFPVIYADPPWQYGDKKPNGGAEKHYPTMPLNELCAMRPAIDRLAADDCALFCWATYPLLPDFLVLLSAWGFTYKTIAFQWVKLTSTGKENYGLGRWTRGNSEPCFLATRGKPSRVNAGVRQLVWTMESELVCAQIGEHSAKPPEVRDRIVTLMGDVPRVELFAREAPPGWDCWGNQVQSTVEVQW